ncbi:MAG: hypothetical protein E6L08_02625 [Verrucomicrobia bacterium]|nr:MAG: hypothetical protein E6L08_02625 [Verrucomicrobiota bacterium]
MATPQNFTNAHHYEHDQSTDMSKSNERDVWFVVSRLNDLTTQRFNAIVKSIPFLHQKPH